jgi:single-strand DNA-binding protein
MPNLNRVMLMGNLTHKPELKQLPGGMHVCSFSLAINRRWRDQQTNEQREDTTFVGCDAFGRTAEAIAKFLDKGRPLYVEGRLRDEQWNDKQTGEKRHRMKVVVESFQFIDSKPAEQQGAPQRQTATAAAAPAPDSDTAADDIPF